MKMNWTRAWIQGGKGWALALALTLGAGAISTALAQEPGTSLQPGDIDGDGCVTSDDALLVLLSIFGAITLSPAQTKAADLTGDGTIDLRDAVLILRWSLGLTPESLSPPSGQKVLLKAHAEGVQIYDCSPGTNDPAAFAWTFKAPDALLYDEQRKRIATHYAGPTWEASDGSKVVGMSIANAPAPTAGSVPWLLLQAKSHAGAGAFSSVTYVQRLYTMGGAAPVAGCDEAHAGAETRAPYLATYVFYAP